MFGVLSRFLGGFLLRFVLGSPLVGRDLLAVRFDRADAKAHALLEGLRRDHALDFLVDRLGDSRAVAVRVAVAVGVGLLERICARGNGVSLSPRRARRCCSRDGDRAHSLPLRVVFCLVTRFWWFTFLATFALPGFPPPPCAIARPDVPHAEQFSKIWQAAEPHVEVHLQGEGGG